MGIDAGVCFGVGVGVGVGVGIGVGVGVGVASNSVAVLFAKVMQPELRIIAMNATKTPAMRSNPIILFQLNSITAIATLKTEAGDN